MMIFLPVSYVVKMVVIPLHSLHPCTHQNHVVWSVSRYGAHKPIGFHAPFAIRCCSGIAIVDIDVCIYYPHICTWLVYIMAINIFWIWICIWIWPLLLTWISFNHSKDKWSHTQYIVGWNYLLRRWSPGTDKLFHSTLYNGYNYISMGTKLI